MPDPDRIAAIAERVYGPPDRFSAIAERVYGSAATGSDGLLAAAGQAVEANRLALTTGAPVGMVESPAMGELPPIMGGQSLRLEDIAPATTVGAAPEAMSWLRSAALQARAGAEVDIPFAVAAAKLAVNPEGRTINEFAALARQRALVPVSTGSDVVNQAEGLSGLWRAMREQPGAVTQGMLDIGARSLAAPLGGAMAGSVAGPVGSIAGVGLGSGGLEFANTLAEVLESNGFDPQDPAAVSRAASNQAVWDGIVAQALVKGGVVGAADALTGMASAAVPGGRTLTRALGARAAETGIEAVGGAGGEALSQYAQRGRVDDPKAVALEALAEVPGAVPQAAIVAGRRTRPQAPPAQQPPPSTPAPQPPPPQPAPPEPESELATQIVAALRRGEVYVPPELRETAPESASAPAPEPAPEPTPEPAPAPEVEPAPEPPRRRAPAPPLEVPRESWPEPGEPVEVAAEKGAAYSPASRRRRLIKLSETLPDETDALKARLRDHGVEPDEAMSFQGAIPAEVAEVYKGTPMYRHFTAHSKTGGGADAISALGEDYYTLVEAMVSEARTPDSRRKRAKAQMKKYGADYDPQGALDAWLDDASARAALGVLPESEATHGTQFTIGGTPARIEGEGSTRALIVQGGPRVYVDGLTAGVPFDPGSVTRRADMPVAAPAHAGEPAAPRTGVSEAELDALLDETRVDAEPQTDMERRARAFAAMTPAERAEAFPGVRSGESLEQYERRTGTSDTPPLFAPSEQHVTPGGPLAGQPRRLTGTRGAKRGAGPAAQQPPVDAGPEAGARAEQVPATPQADGDAARAGPHDIRIEPMVRDAHADSLPPTEPAALRAAFNGRGPQHARIGRDLDRLVARGVLDGAARDVILSALWHTSGERLATLAVSPMARDLVEAFESEPGEVRYVAGAMRYKAGRPDMGAEIELSPLTARLMPALEREARRRQRNGDPHGALAADLMRELFAGQAHRALGHAYTFFHEFGHFGYAHLSDAQREEIHRLYDALGTEGRRAYLRGGLADEATARRFADYKEPETTEEARKDRAVDEFVAHTFAEWVLTRRVPRGLLGRVLQSIFKTWRRIARAGLNRLAGRQGPPAEARLHELYDAMLRGTPPRQNVAAAPTQAGAPWSLGQQPIQGRLFDAAGAPAVVYDEDEAGGPQSGKTPLRPIDHVMTAGYLAAESAVRGGTRTGPRSRPAMLRRIAELKAVGITLADDEVESAVRVARGMLRAAYPRGKPQPTLEEAMTRLREAYGQAIGAGAVAGLKATAEKAGPLDKARIVPEATAGLLKTPVFKGAVAAMVRREGQRIALSRFEGAAVGLRSLVQAGSTAREIEIASGAAKTIQVMEGLKRQAATLLRGLPRAVAGQFLSAVANVRTPTDLARLLYRAEHEVGLHRGRLLSRALRRQSRAVILKRLTEQDRAAVRQAVAAAANDMGYFQSVPQAPDPDIGVIRTTATGAAVAADNLQRALDTINEIIAAHHAETRRITGVRARSLREAIDTTAADIRTTSAMPDPDTETDAERNPLRRELRGTFDLRDYIQTLTGRVGSVWEQIGYFRLARAEDRESAERRDRYAELDAALIKAGYRDLADYHTRHSGRGGRAVTEWVSLSLGGRRTRIARGQLIGLVALLSDPNTELLVLGGAPIQFESGSFREPMPLTFQDIERARGLVKPAELELIEAFKRVMETARPKAWRAVRILTGREPVTWRDYWPRRVNRAESGRVERPIEELGPLGPVTQLIENVGITKERRAHTMPFLVGDVAGVAYDHIDTLAKIAHLAIPIRDASSVLANNDVRRAVAKRLGTRAYTDLTRLLQQTAQVNRAITTTGGEAAQFINTNLAVGALTLNPGTWARQPFGYIRLLQHLGPRDWLAGLAGVARIGREDLESSGFLWNRYRTRAIERLMPGGITDAGASARSLARGPANAARNLAVGDLGGALSSWRRWGSQLFQIMNWFDAMVARAAWAGFRAKAMWEHPNWAAAQRERWVGRQVALAVRDTQNGSSTLDMSVKAALRRDSGLSAFYFLSTDAMKQWSRIRRAYRPTGPGARAAARAGATGSIALLGEAVNVIIGGGAALAIGYAISALLSGAGAGDDRELRKIQEELFARDALERRAAMELIRGLPPQVAQPLNEALARLVFKTPGRRPPIDVSVAGPIIRSYDHAVGSIEAMTDSDWARFRRHASRFARELFNAAAGNPFEPYLRRLDRLTFPQ